MPHYAIRLHPNAHQLFITLTIESPTPKEQRVRLPAWIPGSYKIRDFARHVMEFAAFDGETPLEVVKEDKQTWCVHHDASSSTSAIMIRYTVYAFDFSVRGSYLSTDGGLINPCGVLLKVEGKEEGVHALDIASPVKDWKLATPLPAEHLGELRFGSYTAKNYAELIDSPLLCGRLQSSAFDVANTRHVMLVYGAVYGDLDKTSADVAKVCQQHIVLFGNAPPFPHYQFLTLTSKQGYGGLEHRNASVLMCARDDFDGKRRKDYVRLLGLCSHEYFHAWNVTRMRPKEVGHQALSHETHFSSLWIFEGITSYYDDLALLRAGVLRPKEYLGLLADNLSRVSQAQGRKRQTVRESSFDAWTKLYQADENACNAIVSYYSKGAMIALWLDLSLRCQNKTLDQVMRYLWERIGDGGLGEREFFDALDAIGAHNVRQELQRHVNSVEDPPLKQLLRAFGLELGYTRPKTLEAALGIRHKPANIGVAVTAVFNDSQAEQAGLAPSDVLLALDGRVLEGTKPDAQLEYIDEHTVQADVIRDGILFQCSIRLDQPLLKQCKIRNKAKHNRLQQLWWQSLIPPEN
jgi:predicted metalloprotease with PDZ domain